MSDPIGALSNILKGKKMPNTAANSDYATPNYQLPNGAGTYNANGVNQPIMPQMPFTVQQAQVQPSGPFANTPSAPAAQGGYPIPPDTGDLSAQPPVPQTPQGGSSSYQAPTQEPQAESSDSVDFLDKYRQLALEQARHSSQGTGLYALQKGVQYTPDQIMAQRKSADDIYNQTLNEYSKAAQNQLTQQKKTPLYGIDSDLSGLSTNAVNTLYKMSDDFNSHPIVKDFNIIQRASGAADNILKDINSRPDKKATAGDDMSLMYLFAKAQDPNSVVRESEYANVGDYFSSLPQAVQFKLSQVYKAAPDGRLTDEARKNIAHGIGTLYKTNKEQYDNLRGNAVDHMKRVAGKDVSSAFLNNYEDAYTKNGSTGSDSSNGYTNGGAF